MSRQEELRAQRADLKKRCGKLFDEIAEIFFRHDPIGINFETNTDEYEPEVGTILPRLDACRSALEARHVVHEEFMQWFGASTAGPEVRYETIASEIWAAWQRSRH